MKIIDSHCHLVDEKLWSEIPTLIERARVAGVEKFITMAGGRKDWNKLTKLADSYSDIYVAYGWHPEDIVEEESLVDMKELILKTPKCVGIGEVGLDFYYDKEKGTKDVQTIMLNKQIALAIELNKPLIIHVRNAEEEMTKIMENWGTKFKAQFHCFGESPKFLDKVLTDGHMVSFGGNITFKSAENLRNMLKMVPLDRLMLETDSPYLSPEPVRGTINEPANLRYTAQFMARELKIELSEFMETTYKNTLCFFGLEN